MAVYVLTNLVTFLTHYWKLKLKHAVAIMNIKGGAAGIIGLVEATLIDAYFGHAGMLLITSVLYSIGLGLLVMSVPGRFFSKGVKSCPAGEKLCSSKLTASPFYWGLALIVLAKAGQGICLRALTFGKIKFKRGPPETKVIKFGFLKFEVRRRKKILLLKSYYFLSSRSRNSDSYFGLGMHRALGDGDSSLKLDYQQ
ncbi:protein NRT1/ PTR FAMILY 5.16-like [Camellia sinensis]|uniref:protein NRT1/ PTR FAMILY 5.16-like n=1 Tax=Camellia sinensis TaxID=4442 RepID=UPI001035CDF9|nr:protein NRT1/ PTR FAMILY 5.16-like [Camellia sinensis]